MDTPVPRSRVPLLVVEDDRMIARRLQVLLGKVDGAAYEVAVVGSLADGLSRLATETLAVVLLDLSLPEAEGPETVRRMCTTVQDVPVVVLTGLDDEDLARQALNLGAQDYLVKGEMATRGIARAIQYAIERHRMQATLRSLALTDELTSLLNRRGFFTLAEQHLKTARRTRTAVWLAAADLDGLKPINDTYGHEEGDRAISGAAAVLRATFRESDLLARLGGDEFVVLATNVDPTSAEILRSRLRQHLDAHNAREPRPYVLSLSLGLVRGDPERDTLAELLAHADRELYEQKRARRS